MPLRALLFVFALVACKGGDKTAQGDSGSETGVELTDYDNDGYYSDEDCDDHNAQVHPGGFETCNGIDEDCDGEIDDGALTTYYVDDDDDGYGDTDNVEQACQATDGLSPVGGDCDDTLDTVNPGADEVCDGLDNDCDHQIDEDSLTIWYADADSDDYGDPESPYEGCDPPQGYVADDTDCDDNDETASPAGTEICDGVDNDCDGDIDDDLAEDRVIFYQDRDDDGYGDPDRTELACAAPVGYVSDDTDCDDLDPASYPGADETCDDADNDCDGTVDEDATDAVPWYADDDSDTYGDPSDAAWSCAAPTGRVADDTDCDDDASAVNPGASERCNSIDDDCDGDIDEDSAVDAGTWYRDSDDDLYGDAASTTAACSQPTGYVADKTDCDDTTSSVSPGADETCDGVDDDCDGDVDEDSAVDAPTWYSDRDSDTYGDPARTKVSCEEPTGYVADDADCDDLDADSHPYADEVCDLADNDCDGTVDEDAIDAETWYRDYDSDHYGDLSTTKASCTKPTGYVSDDTDCDDADKTEHPGADEVCDGDDDDCDGETDEDSAVDASTWYRDSDIDTYGDPSVTDVACDKPTGYVADDTDCDDTDAEENPAASEICDGDDDDCDGEIDESSAIDANTWYSDRDDDGYGDASRTKVACDKPTGYVADDTDCDDLNAATYPDADEICDSADNDCDGTKDEGAIDATTWYKDADSDLYGNASVSKTSCTKPTGYVSDSTDCDDTSASNHPGGTETCDDKDNDCDGAIDESGAVGESSWYPDADSDTYGSSSATATKSCDAPTGYVASNTDCDDTSSSINPGATEYCDGTDQDCDGDEDGAVTFSTLTGTKTSLSSTWGAGTASSPKAVSLSSNGTVSVCPGTYYVSITSSASAIEIDGYYGSDVTTLSGGGSKRVVTASGDLTMSGLTVTDGYYSTSYGGNIYVNAADLTLSDMVIQDGIGKWGGNIAIRSGTLTMDTVDVSGGDATYGGGIYASSATADLSACTVYDNGATYGAGMYLTATDATIDGSELSTNDATSYGGAIAALSSSSMTVTGSTITSNSGGDYGGGAYLSGSDYAMSTSNVEYNASTVLGGGFYMVNASTLKCTGASGKTYGIWGNTSLLAGGVYMGATSGATITSTTCDWTASSDNDLYDVVIGLYLYYSKGDNATFSCTYTGC